MGVVTLQQKGLIYEDDFSSGTLDARWEVLPNDLTRYEVSGALRLKHGVDPLFLFLPELTSVKQFVLDIKNDYNPLTGGDFGGIAVYANADDYILLEEYYDSAQGTAATYPWLRLVRDYNTYSAYWSADGMMWTLIDTQEFDRVSPKIGLFLMGDTGEVLSVLQIKVFRSTKITVNNLLPGAKVQLKDAGGIVAHTSICRDQESQVVMGTGLLPQNFNGSITVTTPNGDVYASSTNFPIWGGDVYLFEVTLDLYFVNEAGKEQLLKKNFEEFLGYINTPTFTQVQMILRGDGTFREVKVALEQYKGTDHYQRLVEIAPDVAGVPGTYSGSVSFTQIVNQGKFWAKLSRETDPTKYTSEVYFGVRISSKHII